MRKKPLIHKNWDEIQSEMSIAGEPDKARIFGENVLSIAKNSVDNNNIPSIDNQIFALERVVAELKLWRNILYNRQHIRR